MYFLLSLTAPISLLLIITTFSSFYTTIGVQWHPEDLLAEEGQRRIFELFVEKASEGVNHHNIFLLLHH